MDILQSETILDKHVHLFCWKNIAGDKAIFYHIHHSSASKYVQKHNLFSSLIPF